MSIDERVHAPAEPKSGVRRHAIEAFAALDPGQSRW